MPMFPGSDLSEILEAIEKDVPYDSHKKEVVRISVDSMESTASTESWPVPGYGKLLFDVR